MSSEPEKELKELKRLLLELQLDYYGHGSRMDTIIPDSDIKPILEYVKNNFTPIVAEESKNINGNQTFTYLNREH